MKKSLICLATIFGLMVVTMWLLEGTYNKVGKRVRRRHARPRRESSALRTRPPPETATAAALTTNVIPVAAPGTLPVPSPATNEAAAPPPPSQDPPPPENAAPEAAHSTAVRKGPFYKTKRTAALSRRSHERYAAARERAAREGWDPEKIAGATSGELMAIEGGRVIVYHTENGNAALTTDAAAIRQTPPYELDGKGVTVGIWDEGGPLTTHQEFSGRATILDEAGVAAHSTHVAGTVGAAGVRAGAKGMAPAARIDGYSWNNDLAEMLSRGMSAPGETNTIQLSNHSYGPIAGWYVNGIGRWQWYGTWGNSESETFGLYSGEARLWDEVCHTAPYVLPFKSAGNDRGEGTPTAGSSFFYYNGTDWVSKGYEPGVDPPSDNWDNGGHDTIPGFACAKNIMTVGSVEDAVNNGERLLAAAAISSFSSWGPTDDGRIKPDIVANGRSLYSTYSAGTASYDTLTGTSMSAPNAAGSAALLVQYWDRLFPGDPLASSALKALILHSADDLGRPGPDYAFGWGLMNARTAADRIKAIRDFPSAQLLRREHLETNEVHRFTVRAAVIGSIKATLCWTDPAANALTGLDDPSPRLVNDLDLRIVSPSGVTNYPFILDPLSPTNPAASGDNHLDNVEQVVTPGAGHTGLYSIVISAKDGLLPGGQTYALVLDGIRSAPEIDHEPLLNQPAGGTGYAVEANIRALTALDADSLVLRWNTTGQPGTFSALPMTRVTNDLYRATIPEQPLGTTVYYSLSAAESLGLTSSSPPGAPAAMHTFRVMHAVALTVSGTASNIGEVVPSYGNHTMASGNVIEAWAATPTAETPAHRLAVSGWTGTGDVPGSGASNAVTFVLQQDSTLAWHWASENSLRQESAPTGIIDAVSWWRDGATALTVTADTSAAWGRIPHRFVEWQIDGQRQPDATNVAVNPAGGIAMTTALTATAIYLATDRDMDEDGLADWWERRYFGSLAANWDGDEDGDGYLNLEEYQDDSNPRDAGAIPGGPNVAHTPLASPQTTPAPWRVSATITDNSAVGSATLRWRRNSLSWRSILMHTNSAPGEYAAQMPAPGILGDSYEYYVEASDAAGYRGESGPHEFEVVYPLAVVDRTDLTTQVLVNQDTNLVVVMENAGNTDLVWRAVVSAVPVTDDVEAGTNQWAHGGTNDLWHISDYRAASGRFSWYCGDAGPRVYQNAMDAGLVSQPYALASGATLAFTHWMDSELQNTTHTWDAGVVEISTNDGASFALIEPVGGYPFMIVNNPASPFAFETPCFGGTGGWQRVTFDLSDYEGTAVRFRFRFGSDAYVVDEGWYVDDVTVGPLTTADFWLSAQPSNGTLSASGSTNITLAVDTSGMPSGTDDALLARFMSNDPVHPDLTVRVGLSVRSPPELGALFARQTSTQGEGLVTISNSLHDADGDACDLSVQVSTNGGVTWSQPRMHSVRALFGSPVLTNGIPFQVSDVATKESFSPVVNRVATEWGTTNLLASELCANTLVRMTAWDGSYSSHAVTSQPFMVDNVAPSAPTGLTVSSHTVGAWSTNAVFAMTWGPSSDGQGSGLREYDIFASPTGMPSGHPVTQTAALSATPPVPTDGTNWWVGVRSADRFGNASAVATAGPYRADITPPEPGGAVVTVDSSPHGPYVIGSAVRGSWPAFADSASGIAGYYVSLEDRGGTPQGTWTTNRETTVSAAPEQVHTLYVWARDAAGWIGPAANASVALLSSDGDFDGDGFSNVRETRLGTDATDPKSALAFTDAKRDSNASDIVLQWRSVTGLVYSLYWCESLTNGPTQWTPADGGVNVPGASGMMTYTAGVARTASRFYRLGVQFP
jgi:hypothetical protein